MNELVGHFADPTRGRILAVLAEEEMNVAELTHVLALSQPRISNQLAPLKRAGVIADRRIGTRVYYRIAEDLDKGARELLEWHLRHGRNGAEMERDRKAIEQIRRNRDGEPPKYFELAAGEWDQVARKLYPQSILDRAVEAMIPDDLTVIDIGCGTGSLTLALGRVAGRAIGVDRSTEMLRHAKQKAIAAGAAIEFKKGDAAKLPLDAAVADFAFANLVFQHLRSFGPAIAEIRRILKPGGRAVVSDFLPHRNRWIESEIKPAHMGIDPEALAQEFSFAGFSRTRIRKLDEPDHGQRPGMFQLIATK